MISAAGALVEIDCDKLRRANHLQIALLAQFLDQGIAGGFAALNPASRHMPARHVGMTHQKYPALTVKGGRADAERHAAGEHEPDMNQSRHKPCPPVAQLRRRRGVFRNCLRAALPAVKAHIMFRLAHISDIHLGPLPRVSPAELASKRITGYLNWQRNRRKHLFGNTLEQLLAGMRAEAPDHVAITGDLVNLATRTEIEVARLWLETHFDPANATFVPGNHDAYVPSAFKRSTEAWLPWIASDEPASQDKLFPTYRRRGPVALIGLSTANATLPFMATGEFGHKQANAAGQLLDQARADGLFRVLMIHHPPIRGAARWHKRMRGIGHFSKMLKRHGAELVLHGHTHLDTLRHLSGKHGDVPVVGIASASQGPAAHKPIAGFNLFEIDGDRDAWKLVHRRMKLSGDGARLCETPTGQIRSAAVS